MPALHRSRPSNTPVESPVAFRAGAMEARRDGRRVAGHAAPPRAGRRWTAHVVTCASPGCGAQEMRTATCSNPGSRAGSARECTDSCTGPALAFGVRISLRLAATPAVAVSICRGAAFGPTVAEDRRADRSAEAERRHLGPPASLTATCAPPRERAPARLEPNHETGIPPDVPGRVSVERAVRQRSARRVAVRRARRARRQGCVHARVRAVGQDAAVVLGDVGTVEDVPVVEQALGDDEPLVRGHAAWALARLGQRRGTTPP